MLLPYNMLKPEKNVIMYQRIYDLSQFFGIKEQFDSAF